MKTIIISLFVFSTLLSFSQAFNANDANIYTIAINASPNPFITFSQLEFAIEEQDTVSFCVYDRWGQIDTLYLEDSLINPGIYQFEYTTEISGTYIAALEINNNYFSTRVYKTDSITSISVKEEKGNFNIYPNPANQFIKIEFPDEVDRNIKILSSTGQVIEQILQHNTKTLLLNTEHYSKGIYYISIKTRNKRTTKTLIIE